MSAHGVYGIDKLINYLLPLSTNAMYNYRNIDLFHSALAIWRGFRSTFAPYNTVLLPLLYLTLASKE